MEQSEFIEILVFSPDYGPRDESGWARVGPGLLEFPSDVLVGNGETMFFTMPGVVLGYDSTTN